MSETADPVVTRSDTAALLPDPDDGSSSRAASSHKPVSPIRDMTPSPPSPPTEKSELTKTHQQTSNGAAEYPDAADAPDPQAVESTAAADGGEATKKYPTSRWRVKVYCLQEGAWRDGGTGMCWGQITEGHAFLVVEDEVTPDKLLLQSEVTGPINFQKQDTLIVWSEKVGNETFELALSFQEAAGCLDLCEFILKVSTTLEPEVALFAAVSSNNGSAVSGDDSAERILKSPPMPPAPTPDNLEKVLSNISETVRTQYGRDALISYMREHNYMAQIVSVFDTVESGRNLTLCSTKRLETLRHLSTFIRHVFSLVETSLINTILDDGIFPGVLGILEYDMDFAPRKASFRKFFDEHSHLRQVAPINDPLIAEKIRKTYRLQILKDVILARILDDNAFSLVSSLIYMNHMEVIVWLQSSSEFVESLFGLYKGAEPGSKSAKRDDGIRLIYHVISTSKTFPMQQRINLYLVMIENGVFDALRYGMTYASDQIRNIALESVTVILEADSGLVRAPHDAADYSSGLVDGLVNILVKDNEMSLQLQACEALKLLLEPPLPEEVEAAFYRSSANLLFGSLAIKPGFTKTKSPHYYELVLDLLGFCCRNHSLCDGLIDNLNLWSSVGTHISTPLSKASALAAVKTLKMMMISSGVDDMFTMAESGALGAVVDLVEKLGNVNNALHSACLQLLSILSDDTITKYAYLRHWLSNNRSDKLSNFKYIPFLQSLGEADTSDDDSRILKRSQFSDADTSRASQRRRLTMQSDKSEENGGSDDEKGEENRTLNGEDSIASISDVSMNLPESPNLISSPPPDDPWTGPIRSPDSPSVDIHEAERSTELESPNPNTPPRVGRSQSMFEESTLLSNGSPKLTSLPWSQTESAPGPGTPQPKLERGKLQRKLFSAGQSARRLVQFKSSNKNRPSST